MLRTQLRLDPKVSWLFTYHAGNNQWHARVTKAWDSKWFCMVISCYAKHFFGFDTKTVPIPSFITVQHNKTASIFRNNVCPNISPPFVISNSYWWCKSFVLFLFHNALPTFNNLGSCFLLPWVWKASRTLTQSSKFENKKNVDRSSVCKFNKLQMYP